MKDSDWLILSELYKNPNMTKVADLLYTTQPSMTKRLQHMAAMALAAGRACGDIAVMVLQQVDDILAGDAWQRAADDLRRFCRAEELPARQLGDFLPQRVA